MMNFAIPFYKNTAPVMQKLGDLLGGGLVEFLKDPSGISVEKQLKVLYIAKKTLKNFNR